jgi:hypothetical protein
MAPGFVSAGSYNFKFELYDGHNYVQNTIVINVNLNALPTFSPALVTQNVLLGKSIVYDLPGTTDTDGDTVTLDSVNSPTFVTLTGPWQLTINPPYSASWIGTWSVDLDLYDQKQYNSLSFNVIVTTNPPSFNTPLVTQTALVLKTTSYVLPATQDADGDSVSISYSGPAWVSLSGTTFSISPVLANLGASYAIDVYLNDGFSAIVPYSFTIVVPPNTAPYFATALVDQTVVALTTTEYTLPATKDNEGDTVTATANYNGGTLPSAFVF